MGIDFSVHYFGSDAEQRVGVGLPAMAIGICFLRGRWGNIRYLGDGLDWFRSYSGSLLKSAKVTKTLLPHHSAPRLGSVCPHSGFGPWAAAMGCAAAPKPDDRVLFG